MRRICVVTANRADYSRAKTVLDAVKAHPDLTLQVVVMGSHLLEKHGFTVREIEADGFVPDARIYMEVDGKNPTTMAKSMGLAVVELATTFDQLKPDIVIALVDRYENFASAAAAALMNIPIAHIQGGEVTGTIDESLRHAMTKLAHLHFPATEGARERIVKMGEPAGTVWNVGCPGTDILLQSPLLSAEETIRSVQEVAKDPNVHLDPKAPYLLVVQHPVTTEYGSGVDQIRATLDAVQGTGMQTIMLWPNIDAGSDDVSRGIRHYQIKHPELPLYAFKHFGNELFVNLMRNASCMVGNSSAGIREACYFGTPVVNIGTRQSGRERGACVRDAGYEKDEIAVAIREQLAHGRYPTERIYGDGTAGTQIADILATARIDVVQKRITY
jgi:UDP-hydrolysing UDP-N-acetyl-D-glucosamine 2-epimerase